MKQLLTAVVFGGVLIATIPAVAAESNTSTGQSVGQTSNSTQSSEQELEKTEQAKTPEELKSRVQQSKNALKTKLTNADIQRIVSKCAPSQVKINTFLQGRYKNDKAYQARYESFIQRLEKLSASLKQNNIDTTTLDQQIVMLKQKLTAYQTSVTAFRAAVADAKAIDCKTDPTGFKAALENARTKALTVKQANQDLETYAKTTIKATLETIKASRS